MAIKTSNREASLAMRRVVANFDRFVNDVSTETKQALRESGDLLRDQARELAPKDTGALRESGRTFVAESGRGTRTKVSVTVSFGGNTKVSPTRNAPNGVVDYAAWVHEGISGFATEGAINYTTPGTGPKFLERAAQMKEQEIKNLIRKRLRAVARKKRVK